MAEVPQTSVVRRPRSKAPLIILAAAGLLAVVAAVASLPMQVGSESALEYDLLANVEGTVREVLVKEGQIVEKDTPLVLLDDTAAQLELAAARTDYDRIAQELQEAGIAVAMPPGSGIGGQIVTTGPLQPPPAAAPPKVGTLPPVTGTPITGESPDAGVAGLLAETESKIEAARNEVVNLRQKEADALVAAEEAQKNADASKVIADQRKAQAEKMRMLLREGVVSQVETSRAEAQAAVAQAGYEAALQQASQLLVEAKGFGDGAKAAEARVPILNKERDRLKQLDAKLASQPKARPPAIASSPQTVSKPAFVKQTPAPSVPAKVEIDKGAKRTGDAKLEGAKQRIDEAEAAIAACQIRAPRKGMVVRVLVQPGSVLKRGASIVSIRFDDPQPSRPSK